jgi:NAD(P)-dependent dehydrogenase (short-subunit alcohol dehydrogenase family)
MNASFVDKVALVTGGSRGIGRAIVLAFAEQGARVYFCYRHDQTAAQAVCSEAVNHGWSVTALQADVGDAQSVRNLIAQIESEAGKIDILVNNAGIFPQRAVGEISDEEWHNVLQVNLASVFYTCRAVLPAMIAAKDGVIINLASVAGQRGSAYHAHYAAAKGGVIAFTRSLAREVAKDNIRVNAISPGRIVTDLLQEHATGEERQRWLTDTPVRRLGTPEEIASAALFLANPANSYIIGETLAINGGLLMD